MSNFSDFHSNPDFVRNYLENGPTAFIPGHSGALQMSGVLFNETIPDNAHILVIGAGGGLDTKALCEAGPDWRFTGVDPSAEMLGLAQDYIGSENQARATFVQGVVSDLELLDFDAAICMLVLGMLPDDGTKLDTLKQIKCQLKPGSPLILFDQCLDFLGSGFSGRVSRYISYAAASGVDASVLGLARGAMMKNTNTVSKARNEALFDGAGFKHIDAFYQGMAWYGWLMRA